MHAFHSTVAAACLSWGKNISTDSTYILPQLKHAAARIACDLGLPAIAGLLVFKVHVQFQFSDIV